MKALLIAMLIVVALSGCTTPSNTALPRVKASLEIGFDVDDQGIPQNVSILSWNGPENQRENVEASAIRAVKGWALNPTMRGRHVIQPMEFDLEEIPPTPEAKQSSTAQHL